MALERKDIIKLTVSVLSFATIIGIAFPLRKALYNWSLCGIQKIQSEYTRSLKDFAVFVSFFGSQFFNVVLIAVFLAMFKRRHQAFSFLLLWCSQIFFTILLKLAIHQPRPYMTGGGDCSDPT